MANAKLERVRPFLRIRKHPKHKKMWRRKVNVMSIPRVHFRIKDGPTSTKNFELYLLFDQVNLFINGLSDSFVAPSSENNMQELNESGINVLVPQIQSPNASNTPEQELQESEIPKWEWIFLAINLSAEIVSISFECFSSVHKQKYALFAMAMSVVVTIICIGEQTVKAIKERVIWRWEGILPWLYHPSQNHKPFGTELEMIASSCSIVQTIVSVIAYIFQRKQVLFYLGISFYPLVFAIGVSISKLMQILNPKVPSGRVDNFELQGIQIRTD